MSEEQVTKFIENDEVNARQVIGGTAIPAVTGLCFRSVDEEARPALTRCGSMAPHPGKLRAKRGQVSGPPFKADGVTVARCRLGLRATTLRTRLLRTADLNRFTARSGWHRYTLVHSEKVISTAVSVQILHQMRRAPQTGPHRQSTGIAVCDPGAPLVKGTGAGRDSKVLGSGGRSGPRLRSLFRGRSSLADLS